MPSGQPLVGVNVSGLLGNGPSSAAAFGIRYDYAGLISDLCERLLQDGARLILMPHVVGPSSESDDIVTTDIFRRLSGDVHVAPSGLNASSRKWLISHLDWFTGSRMHATIAALSSGVVAAPLSYSPKFEGIFEDCGLGSEVVDAKSSTRSEALESLLSSYRRRVSSRDSLRASLSAVLQQAESQMTEIISTTRCGR